MSAKFDLIIIDLSLVLFSIIELLFKDYIDVDSLLLEYAILDVYVIVRGVERWGWLNPYVIFIYMINFFLGSRLIINLLGGESFYKTTFFTQYDFSYDVRMSMLFIMLIGVSSLNLGAMLVRNHCKTIAEYKRKEKMIKISKKLILILFIPLIYYFYQVAQLVLEYGYASLMIDGEKNSALRHFLYFFYFSYYLFLAARPNKKEFIRYSMLYIVAIIGSLFTGSRGIFAIQFLLIVWYYNEYIGCINYKKILIVVVLLLTLFEYIDETRQTQEYDSVSVKTDFVLKILEKESNSLTVIGYAEEYKDFGSYTDVFYPLLSYFGEKIGVYGEYEQEHLDYAHKLSIWVNNKMYYSAKGIGSCYLAEIYSAFGYLGVCIISIILGWGITKTYSICRSSFLGVFFLLIFYKNLFWMPRGSLLLFIPESLRFLLLAYGMQWLAGKIYIYKSNVK